jgi:hypothetical protein
MLPTAPGLVGREAELAFLKDIASDLADGVGGAVLFDGEPGIGKTALVQQWVAWAKASWEADAHSQVLWGAGDELSQELLLLPFLEAFQVRQQSANARRRAIASVLRGEVTTDPGTGVTAALAEELIALVTDECAMGPVIVVIDDLQWADESSVALWARLARLAPRLPLLLVGVMRPFPRRDDLAELRRQTKDVTHLEVRLLDRAAVADLVTALAGGMPDADLLRLADSAAGNPLYITELIAALDRSGAITVSDSGTAQLADGITPSHLPHSLTAAVADRLGFVSQPVREMLRTAALLETQFSPQDLASILGKSLADLIPLTDEARTTGVLTESGINFAFRHRLIRAALYDEMPAVVRSAMHRDAAQRLAATDAPVESVARQLLAAFCNAGHDEPTVEVASDSHVIDGWVLEWLADRGGMLAAQSPEAFAALQRAIHPALVSKGNDGWMAEVRDLVAAGRYDEAMLALAAHVADLEYEALRLELWFIGLPEPDRRVLATAWKATAAGHNYALPASDPTTGTPDGLTESSAADKEPQRARSTPARRSSAQQAGATLEEATMALFGRLFAMESDEAKLLLSSLRRQGAGIQFGHDIGLAVAGNPAIRCHIECKNLNRQLTLRDIADKLAQQEFYYRDNPVDHWIVISPHADAANELKVLLDWWTETEKYPFSVQVWSPENRIREFFALEPAVYAAVYRHSPTLEERSAAGQVAAMIRERLAPRLRLDPVWQSYLGDPSALCFAGESAPHFDALYGNHLALPGADERGVPLDGTLMDHVIGWVRDQRQTAPMLLIADFGEGKSVFTYCLARRLCDDFRADPRGRVFPLRIPLREFAEAGGSGRALLRRRLDEMGASRNHWRMLASAVPTLAILDGFDEMSADLSPTAISRNLNGIESCLEQFGASKVLVTTRQRVLDGTRDWERTLDRLRDPTIVRITSVSRQERVRYLERFATEERASRILANLRDLHDPIGLAAKPLFLQMIKETLAELPDDDFSEPILYETYIGKSLRTKIPLLRKDTNHQATDAELVANLTEILEDIAIQLQEANAPYLDLHDYRAAKGGKLAEELWQMRDQGTPAADREWLDATAEEDAVGRVGIRSLLKQVPAPQSVQWPVDFFHRSMREYFVARAIVRYLGGTDPKHADLDKARRILRASPLLPEVTHFVATLLRAKSDATALAALESFARGATIGPDTRYLGGNAVTLLYACTGKLPRADWSDLQLDHAQLRGADLQGMNFARSRLCHANLDNANLEDADLTGAHLEGVRLEETSQVLAVAALGGSRILAAYEDRSLREWCARPGIGWVSEIVAVLDHKANRLQLTPQRRLVAIGDGVLTVVDLNTHGTSPLCQFRMKPRFRDAILGTRTMLLLEELTGGSTVARWLDTDGLQAAFDIQSEGPITAFAQADGALNAVGFPNSVSLFWPRGDTAGRVRTAPNAAISCIDVHARQDDALVAIGHQDGTVSLTSVRATSDHVDKTLLWQHLLHEGPVTSIALDADGRVITGSTDRSVCITQADGPGEDGTRVQHLQLTLRCKNLRFEGVQTDREREKLRQYADQQAAKSPRTLRSAMPDKGQFWADMCRCKYLGMTTL